MYNTLRQIQYAVHITRYMHIECLNYLWRKWRCRGVYAAGEEECKYLHRPTCCMYLPPQVRACTHLTYILFGSVSPSHLRLFYYINFYGRAEAYNSNFPDAVFFKIVVGKPIGERPAIQHRVSPPLRCASCVPRPSSVVTALLLMERKRKLPARAAARIESASKKQNSSSTSPETSATPAPPPESTEPANDTPSPSTAAATAAASLPTSVQPGQPLPTVERPQPDDLPLKDFQSVQERYLSFMSSTVLLYSVQILTKRLCV